MRDQPDHRQFHCIEHSWIPLSDGVRLSARIWLPSDCVDNEARVPAILEYIPYRKRDMVRARDERNHPFFASHGYACIRVDMRGSGDSEGHFSDMYSDAELADVHEVIDWIASQSWCDGAIGMMGTSWGGTSALQACSSTSRLTAVIAVCATNNRFEDDIHHMGGCLLTDTLEWGASLPAIIALPPAPSTSPADWRDRWLERLQNLESPLEHWIEHEMRDDYWCKGSVSDQPGSLRCPVLAIGGWSDRYSNTVMNLVADNPENCWGIVGPWGHHYPDVGRPGPALDFQQQALRWWDRWLKHRANGVEDEPRLRAWCSEFQPPADDWALRNGRWIAEPVWPSDRLSEQSIEFLSTGQVSMPDGPAPGRMSGDTGYFGRPGGLPLEQTADDDASLVLDGAELAESLEMLGRPRLSVTLTAKSAGGQLIARLVDVAPDGSASRVGYVVNNLALAEDYRSRTESGPGEPRRLELVFPNAAYRFAAGHRIRLSLSSSYWPQIWPAPEAAGLQVDLDDIELRLPGRAPIDDGSAGASLIQKQMTSIEPDGAATALIMRFCEVDDSSNSIRQGWISPMKSVEFDAAGIRFGAETRAEHYLDFSDPASARSSFEHRLRSELEGVRAEVVGRVTLTSDSAHYFPAVSIQVFEDGEEIFSRDWSSEIPRRCS